MLADFAYAKFFSRAPHSGTIWNRFRTQMHPEQFAIVAVGDVLT